MDEPFGVIMTIQDLIALSHEIVLTDEDKEKIKARLMALDEEFCRQAEAMRPTPELMNRMYTL